MTLSDTPVVQITDLGKTYPGAKDPALSGVSLSVSRGEIVVLLGLSGSGKSTLLRHINGLETPTTGTVVSIGEDVRALTGRDLRTLRGRIGFIFQQFELVGPLTVLENVLTGSLSTLRGPRVGTWSYPRESRLKALTHLERVGLLERGPHLPHAQRRRDDPALGCRGVLGGLGGLGGDALLQQRLGLELEGHEDDGPTGARRSTSHLQREGRLALTLGAGQQVERACAQSAAELLVEQREAGRPQGCG